MIITIDGPVATGKSTVAKKLAQSIGFIFFDTGAMYRAVAYGIKERGIDFNRHEELQPFLEGFALDIQIVNQEKRYLFEGKDITEEIRKAEVTSLVSEVSAIPGVRDRLVIMQRKLSVGVNAVFEGRDMGSTVFPNAALKIFLTGNLEARARRRYLELREKYPSLTLEQCLKDISQRDAYDSARACSPLCQAPDAHLIDTSDLTLDEVVYKILEYKDSLKTRR